LITSRLEHFILRGNGKAKETSSIFFPNQRLPSNVNAILVCPEPCPPSLQTLSLLHKAEKGAVLLKRWRIEPSQRAITPNFPVDLPKAA